MLRISNALKGVFLMIAAAQAVNTSNLQDDAVYDMQYAQDGVTTDLAQIQAGADSQLGVAAPNCSYPDGSPIVCADENFVLDPYSCDCGCKFTSGYGSCN